MPARRSFPALMSWFVSLAILVGAVAPAVSLAVRAETSIAWAEICTATATASALRGDPQAPGPAESARPAGKHCPWCAPPDVPPGLASPGVGLDEPPLADRLPLAAVTVSAPRATWERAPARAPPRAC